MVGIARKNENSAAERLSVPINSAPTMVAPDREVPGTIARHWNRPILKASEGG
ncbi:hypothetical protein D3C72_1418660 [compost metagenome]